jgi:23S rRNA (adenine2503-C2)-methyltransferase
MKTIKGLELFELENGMKDEGESSYRAKQIFSWLYQKGVSSFEDMTNLSKSMRQKLGQKWEIPKLELVRVQRSEDRDTTKFLFKLPDGEMVESVLMYFEDRLSVCVSTQVGCAFGCIFCASGLMGWKRNLEAWEIVDQVLEIQKRTDGRVSNLVFMGMGEPLSNYENTLKAIRILHHPLGLGIGMRHFTISTVGLVPMIKKLADEGYPIRLAVSLHAPIDDLRLKLMPVNKKYSISEILEACRYYQSKVKRRITFEYILIQGVNDDLALAKKLTEILKGVYAHVNLIPLNPLPEYPYRAPSEKQTKLFQNILEKMGIPATIRQERGQDIQAACGQLRLQEAKNYAFNL